MQYFLQNFFNNNNSFSTNIDEIEMCKTHILSKNRHVSLFIVWKIYKIWRKIVFFSEIRMNDKKEFSSKQIRVIIWQQ